MSVTPLSFMAATRDYETWLKAQLRIVGADLREKHRRMSASPFLLLRGTFYRWVPLWHTACAHLADAPKVLAAGDVHVENFGTWRDKDGRLVWGVNDLDETAVMPYTLDLTRLATSALLARREGELTISAGAICRAILEGYRDHLARGGEAFVLEEKHPALRAAALSADRDPVRFWGKMQALPNLAASASIRRMLAAHLPEARLPFKTVRRTAGVGSLGRPRVVALASWQDGLIAREAKVILPSGYGWALGRRNTTLLGAKLLARAVRCADPFYTFDGAAGQTWMIRRLAPHCSRIELKDLPQRRDEVTLLEAMGRETANLHLGSDVQAVRADLKRRGPAWLLAAAKTMADATLADWRAWKE